MARQGFVGSVWLSSAAVEFSWSGAAVEFSWSGAAVEFGLDEA